jgi:acetolactate synthase I/II/III large subunit
VNNAELIVRLLEQAGVRWVFGVPSGPVLPLIEALRKSDVDYVLTASETSAGFMAATVGQLTRVPGVCVSTVGPGATNLATGVGAAWLDGAPTLAITCNVPTPWLDRRIQMRIDHHALFRPLTKATIPLRNDNVDQAIRDAIAIAQEEVPGPVHLDLPEDVASAPAAEEVGGARPLRPLDAIADEAVEAVQEALRAARRPIVLTGLAMARSPAADALQAFVERQNLPLISTLHGKGMFPESHPNWCGVLGRARRSDVQAFVNQADLVITIGYDPIEINYEEWIGRLPVVHISTEPADVGDGVDVRANIGGALDDALRALAEIDPVPNDWTAADFARQRETLDAALRPDDGTFGAHHVLDVLRERLPADAILAYDVGAHTHQIATQWRTDRPGTCLATNGWSSMGFGMPAAYAAKLVHPDRVVVGVVGDGCFQMTVGELAMARRLGLAVPIIVLNDGWLGLMKVKQERKHYPLSAVYLGDPVPSPPHYFGVPCRPAHDAAELTAALDWALALGGPSVIEAFIHVESYSRTVFD